MSRQEFRRQRLLQLAQEQYLEDAEGLFMTEDQRELLLNSFVSVKLEFHDLDGLEWTQTDLIRRQSVRRPGIPTTYMYQPPPPPPTVNHAQTLTYDNQATIRASSPHSVSHKPPRRHSNKRTNRRSIPITSQKFWRVEKPTEINTLANSFPVPPSSPAIPMAHEYPRSRVVC